MNELTILSVSFNSYQFIEKNILLTAAMNPEANYNWLVINNNPKRHYPRTMDELGVDVVAGADPERPAYQEKGGASYHHADGLSIGIQKVRTRFLLVLDPDFYLIEQGWINELTSYMVSKELSFLGSVWNPQDFKKLRYFPSVHCLLIDLDRVNIAKLDFTPELHYTNRVKRLLLRIKMPEFLRDIILISASRDTGYRIARDHRFDSRYKFESFKFISGDTQYFKSWENFIKSPLRRLLPDRLSKFPLDAEYIVSSKDVGLGKRFIDDGWEGFLWNGRTIGVHLRSFGNERDESVSPLSLIQDFIDLSS